MDDAASWILLRIPRTAGAKEMSGVLGAGDWTASARGPDIPTVCDDLLEQAKAAGRDAGKPTLIFPLDGRHGMAHVVLEEAERRGWAFSRHVPRGTESHLLDLEGTDAAPDATDVAPLLDGVAREVEEAIGGSELGEALSALRHLLTLGVRHLGAVHPDTLWAASNLVKIAAGTGADDNVAQACALVEHLVAQPLPETFPNAMGTLRKLEETAQNCFQAGRSDVAATVMEAAVACAARAFGAGHVNHLAVQNNTCQLLAAIGSPRAEPAIRALLRDARAALGDRHPNLAIVLSNLADLLESQGRGDEAGPLREEAASIRQGA